MIAQHVKGGNILKTEIRALKASEGVVQCRDPKDPPPQSRKLFTETTLGI